MQAGLLRDFIEIQRASVDRNPINGEEKIVWTKVWRGRARVEHSAGTQTVINNETVNTVTRKVTIRTKPAFEDKLSDLRILIKNDKYRILSRDTRESDMATIMIVELIND